jgi:hypothetical protein
MNEIWYSKQWDNAAMPHSIFFMKDGHVPMLRRNDIVMMDNCRVHLGPGIRRAIPATEGTVTRIHRAFI